MSAPIARRIVLRGLLFGAAAACLAGPVWAQDPRAVLVQQAAREWLTVVDKGEYAASWKAAGPRFQHALSAEAWAQAVARIRGPLGPVQQRTVFRTSFTRTFPGVPEGDYAVVIFRTAFEHRADAGEQVTLERGPDGSWQVLGYVIQ